MFDSKTQKTQKINNVIVSKGSLARVATMAAPASSQDAIRERAFELYESRGREPGQDEQDWFRAEREILKSER
jgi:Protein of unknown function (DUF2934)